MSIRQANCAFISTCRISFLNAPPVNPHNIYNGVFGGDPIRITNNIREQKAEAAGEDVKNRWAYSVTAQLDRVDITQQALLTPFADPGQFTTLQSVRAVINAFTSRILSRSVAAVVPWAASRIALGCIAQWTLPDLATTNAALTRMLPGLPIEPNDEEAAFRFNRPTTVEVSGQSMRMNRIASWRSVRSVLLAVSTQVHPPVISRHMLGLETDCNTDQDRTEPLSAVIGEQVLLKLAEQTTNLIPDEIPS